MSDEDLDLPEPMLKSKRRSLYSQDLYTLWVAQEMTQIVMLEGPSRLSFTLWDA